MFPNLELKSENGKKYIEGYVSTKDPDKYNDIVTEQGQKQIYSQLKGNKITMDFEHEEYVDLDSNKRHSRKQNKIPLAKVNEVKLDNKGTWVKAELNQDYPMFEKVYNSIKNGFIHSFSIAYNAINPKIINRNGVEYRLLDALNITNIGITGNPVNDVATFKVAFKIILIQKW